MDIIICKGIEFKENTITGQFKGTKLIYFCVLPFNRTNISGAFGKFFNSLVRFDLVQQSLTMSSGS